MYESYCPLPCEKYITFQAQSKFASKDYDYWQDVLDIVIPTVEKQGYKVVQVGNRNEAMYKRVVDYRGQTNLHQLAYVVRRSSLHFGPDSLCVHLASIYDLPIVALYSATKIEIAGPHFGTPSKHSLFASYDRVGNHKPSFSAEENPKSINLIKPEEIADAIFKQMSIDFKTPFKTIYTGQKYSFRMMRELILDTPMQVPNPDAPIEIRYDLCQNNEILAQQLSYLQKAVVVTNQPLDLNILRRFKPHIQFVVYRIEEKDNPDFAKALLNSGINLILLTNLPPEKLNEKRINYYELGKLNPLSVPNPEIIETCRQNISSVYYRSNKIIFSNGKVFGNHADRQADKPLNNDFEYNRVVDHPNFWEDLDFFTIVQLL
jgi:hypothetical protein